LVIDTVVIISGGLDSAVLLWSLASPQGGILALSYHYGQRHERELDAARELCADRTEAHLVVALDLPRASALQGSGEIPDGHYEDESMRATVVPSRNLVMLSIASAHAVACGASAVAYAAHSGDHAIYPDCRPDFVDAADRVLRLANWEPVRLLAPFVGMDKAAIVKLGASLGVPFERTWSCYKGGAVHCGTCGTCVERREAFKLAGVPDPTEYAT